MASNQDQIAELLQKLDLLLKKQQEFNTEVNELRRDIQILRNTQPNKPATANDGPKAKPSIEAISAEEVTNLEEPAHKTMVGSKPDQKVFQENPEPTTLTKRKVPKTKSNLEKFIGENLINKIGILITVIGVVIGAKYSIENNLISPLTRIILGYLVGLSLLSFAYKLKTNYKNYSAVLVSGALAILYFITFTAYDLYALFPQIMALAIMLLCTVFGVVASLNYNKQIIAHIGLVGAYGIPFLLSNDSGNALVLFSYMTLINLGILFISLKKYWKALYYVSFGFTWLIFGSWSLFSSNEGDFYLGFGFLTVFFLLFYATFLAYKLLKSETFRVSDVILLFLNSFIFYGLGIGLLSNYPFEEDLLGLFTLANALVHFLVTFYLFKKKLADRNLFYLTSGFVLTFITIAVPVQLDGNWVTLLWALEAALLFWIGRTKKVPFYEYLSYVLIPLTTLSLLLDWGSVYTTGWLNDNTNDLRPFFNTMTLTSMLCAFAFGFMNWVHFNHENEKSNLFSKLVSISLPVLLILTVYLSFYLEIEFYWSNSFEASKIDITGAENYTYPEYNYMLLDYGTICTILYTILFIGLLSFINILKIRNRVLGIATISAALLMVLLFLTTGLYTLSEIRESYLLKEYSEYYTVSSFPIYIRYIAIAFFAFLLFSIRKLITQAYMKIDFKTPFEILLYGSIIWIASSELLNWMDFAGYNESYKLGLSILWGLYSLLLIVLGIWKKKKHLRIGAIVLFSLTLLKLFFYDIASLNTISKTIVFVSLGILLLIISFLYNKYKHIIADEVQK